jgi:hypothetical protein
MREASVPYLFGLVSSLKVVRMHSDKIIIIFFLETNNNYY